MTRQGRLEVARPLEQARALCVALLCYRGNPRCGGQGVYARHLSRALVAAGHHVTVFAGQPYPELEEGVSFVPVPSLDLYRDADAFRTPRVREIVSAIDALEVATMWSGGFAEPRTFAARVYRELQGRRGEYDVVHDNHGLGSGLLKLMADGWPVVASIHHPVSIDRAVDLAHAESAWRAMSIRRWYGFASMQHRVARKLPAIITVSESAKKDLVEHVGADPTRVSVIPLGVDGDVWRPLDDIARVPGEIMTTTSADVPLKGLTVLLEALAKLRTEVDDAHLVVVGERRADGPANAAIERFGLEEAVRFVAGETDARLVERYARASVAVVPSLYEGFSLPAVEAMACGVPLVTTTGGALPEVVGADGSAALTVPPGDPGALASALKSVLDDSSLARRLGEAGRKRALLRFSWERVADQTVEQYRASLRAPSC